MKLNCKNLDAIIFDIDGTIVDNIVYHERAWLEFCRRRGIFLTAPEFRRQFFGKNNHDILQGLFGRRLTKRRIKKYAEEKEGLYRKIYSPHIKPIRGYRRFMNRIKKRGLKIAIASAAPKKNRQFVFRNLELTGKFDVVVGEEDILHGKPHPEIYQNAAKKLCALPKRSLVFEDSPAGVRSAKRAGMKVTGVLSGYSRKALNRADGVIRNYDEIELS